MMDRGRSDFERFVAEVEPRLRRALVAAFGAAVGRQAAADALAWAWQNWERVRGFESPVGYLYRVGRTLAFRSANWRRWLAKSWGFAFRRASSSPAERPPRPGPPNPPRVNA